MFVAVAAWSVVVGPRNSNEAPPEVESWMSEVSAEVVDDEYVESKGKNVADEILVTSGLENGLGVVCDKKSDVLGAEVLESEKRDVVDVELACDEVGAEVDVGTVLTESKDELENVERKKSLVTNVGVGVSSLSGNQCREIK